MNEIAMMTDEQLLSMIVPATCADGLLREYNTLGSIFNHVSEQQLDIVKGIGEARKRALLCVKEIMRRIDEKKRNAIKEFNSPEVVFEYFKFLQNKNQEEVWLLLLDAKHGLIKSVMVSKGTLDRTLMGPREILHQAVKHMAAAFIVVHNHPSSDPAPSTEDKTVTGKLVNAAKLLEIDCCDHLIVGKGAYTSLREEQPELFNQFTLSKEDF